MHYLLFVKTHLQNKFLEQRLLDQRINAYLILLDTAWIPTTMIVEIGDFNKLSKWLLCSIKFKNHSFRKRIFTILSINYLVKKMHLYEYMFTSIPASSSSPIQFLVHPDQEILVQKHLVVIKILVLWAEWGQSIAFTSFIWPLQS